MADYAPGFPKVMSHPRYVPAVLSEDPKGFGQAATPGSAARFPPVTVSTPDQEEEYRARGYRAADEAAPGVVPYAEYPMMLSHPDYVEAVPDRLDGHMVDGQLKMVPIKGTPVHMPPVIVSTPEEAGPWEVKGYRANGVSDHKAFDRFSVSPGSAGKEWPKYIDGVLTQDPDAPSLEGNEYPKWIHREGRESVLVKDAEAEFALTGRGAARHEPTQREEPKPSVDPDEWAAFHAWKAAQNAPPGMVESNIAPVRQDDEERATLIQLAEESGIKIDKRWKNDRLRVAVFGESSAA